MLEICPTTQGQYKKEQHSKGKEDPHETTDEGCKLLQPTF